MNELHHPVWTATLSKVAAGFAIGLAAAGLIYAAAATSAGIIADSFKTSETASHERAVEFNSGLARASSQRESLLAKCEHLRGSKLRACVTVANARQKHALSALQQ